MKKALSLVLAAILLLGLVFLFGGCSQGSGSSGDDSGSQAPSDQDITLSFVRNGSDQAETDYWAEPYCLL